MADKLKAQEKSYRKSKRNNPNGRDKDCQVIKTNEATGEDDEETKKEEEDGLMLSNS